MSAIEFQYIPDTLRLPLFFAELNPSNANAGATTLKALLIGGVTAGSPGAAAAGLPQISAGGSDGQSFGGEGSILGDMAAHYVANDTFGEVWYLPIADAGGAEAAAGSFSFTGPATAAGTLSLYVADQLVQVGVTSGMTAAQIASAVAAQITAQPNLVAAAAIDGVNNYTVDLRAVNKGLTGNSIYLGLNYLGAQGGQTTPAGVAVAIVAMSGGTGAPDLTGALANLGEMQFDFIACAFNDAASIAAMTGFMQDATGRWSYLQAVYGTAYYGFAGSYSAAVTLGTSLNDQHASIMAADGSPSPPWDWAAANAGARAVSARADPALPMQYVVLQGILPPPPADRFIPSERNTLLFDGISTFTVQAGQVAIEALITTYQLNAVGAPDTSYLYVETLDTIAAALRYMKGQITSKFSRMKIGDPSVRYDASAGVVTTASFLSELIAEYQYLEIVEGWVVNSAAFAAGVEVEQGTNPNRFAVYWPGDIIAALRGTDFSIAFSNGLAATSAIAFSSGTDTTS